MANGEQDLSTLEDAKRIPQPESQRPQQLHIVHCPDPRELGRRVELASKRNVLAIGRHPGEGGLRIEDPRMSRVHARIAWDPAREALRFGDANSANGCYANGVRAPSAVLQTGDVLRLGDTLFVIEHEDAMANLAAVATRVAPSKLTVLITGESGTGKEVLARRIHEQSGRTGAFVAVNCAALHRELVTSELFGHTRGAFSNATHARDGLFMAAQDGTLLLDEIGDLPIEQQPALLRVLQEHRVRPVGSDREIAATARVLAATHTDLQELTSKGQFRHDLLARLAQCVLRVPPLRERRGETLNLARHFAARASRELELSTDAAERLLLWNYPFNVRELESLIQTFCVLSPQSMLDVDYLREHGPALLLQNDDEVARDPESERRRRLERLLTENAGNISAVARIFGKPRAQIYRWLRRYGIEPSAPSGSRAPKS